MKIKDILNEKEHDWQQDTPDFKTRQSGFDKETGQISWDVEYTPLVRLNDDIESAYQNFKKVTPDFFISSSATLLSFLFASFIKPTYL